MFSVSENKNHSVKTAVSSKGRGDVQKQKSDSCQFFKCPICSFRTPLRGDLQKHISMYHKQVFVCKICNLKFSSKDNLAAHKELCSLKSEVARVYSCRKCGSKFDNAKIFSVHVKVTCLKGDFIKDTGKKIFTHFQPHNALEMSSKRTHSQSQISSNLVTGLRGGLIKHSGTKTHFQPRNSTNVVTGLKHDFLNKSRKKSHFQLHNTPHVNMVKARKPINDKINRMKKEGPYDEIFQDSLQFHKLPQTQGFFENDDKRTTMLSAFFEQQALHLGSTNNVKTEKGLEPNQRNKYLTCSSSSTVGF